MTGIIHHKETQYLYVGKSKKVILNRIKDSSSHAYSDVMSFFQGDNTTEFKWQLTVKKSMRIIVFTPRP